ncbi:hypothetical protein [Shewanella maritima]|uniref:hypothetical protein n=1 Tax=Shewanella maritima TaxID=2520507 RepID=UPI0037358A0F
MSTNEPSTVKEKTIDNSALNIFIKQLNEKVTNSENIEAVKESLDEVINFPHQIKFNNMGLILTWIGAILFGCGYVYFKFQQYRPQFDTPDFVILGICFVTFLTALGFISSRKEKIKKLSTLFRNETLKHLYRLEDCDKSFLAEADNKYADFQRGNHSRAVEWGKDIDFNSPTGLLRASIIHHHYVDKRVETYTDSKGKTKTRTVYDHYHREGVIFPPINKTNCLVISTIRTSNRWGDSYMPASKEFERLFYVQADSEFTAAKFLEPSVVIACEEAAKQIDKLTIEFAQDGSLLINQNNANLLNPAMDFDITEPEKFKHELLNDTSLYTVNRIFGFVSQIIQHTAPSHKLNKE